MKFTGKLRARADSLCIFNKDRTEPEERAELTGQCNLSAVLTALISELPETRKKRESAEVGFSVLAISVFELRWVGERGGEGDHSLILRRMSSQKSWRGR